MPYQEPPQPPSVVTPGKDFIRGFQQNQIFLQKLSEISMNMDNNWDAYRLQSSGKPYYNAPKGGKSIIKEHQ